jgi:hypothetical protein
MAKEAEVEKMRKLAEFKSLLQRKITDTQTELESLRLVLDHVNQILLNEGFKRVDLSKPKSREPPPPPRTEDATIIPLKTANGTMLANLYVSQDSMRVAMADGTAFNVKTPPFRQFLVERVLSKMQEKDKAAAAKGGLPRESVFSYELALDGDIIREIVIRNLTADRQRELKSSIHWTLEKMHEKTAGTPDA